MNLKQYTRILRLIAATCALLLWLVSIAFSNQGFGFKLPAWSWAGIFLSIAVTVLELVFNREGLRHNLTLTLVGASAYAYDTYTNVLGVMLAQGLDPNRVSIDQPQQLLFPVLVGLMLEIVPETLLLWALTGSQVPDLLTQVILGAEPARPVPRNRRGRP
jgi:hypothetical protein